MPYYMKVDGMAELSTLLTEMGEKAPAVAAKELYEGAGLMREEIARSVNTIKTAPFQYAKDGQTRLPSPEELAIVEKAAVGIAKFDKNGAEVDTSVGFRNAGYAPLAGKIVPIPKIVNAINSGTSFMNKQPFVRKAARTGGPKAMQAMKDAVQAEFDAMIKNNGG